MTATWTWPADLNQGPNLVEVVTDDTGACHVMYGPACGSTWREVPKVHRRTGLTVGTAWADGFRPCERPGKLDALEMDFPFEQHTPVYRCDLHTGT